MMAILLFHQLMEPEGAESEVEGVDAADLRGEAVLGCGNGEWKERIVDSLGFRGIRKRCRGAVRPRQVAFLLLQPNPAEQKRRTVGESMQATFVCGPRGGGDLPCACGKHSAGQGGADGIELGVDFRARNGGEVATAGKAKIAGFVAGKDAFLWEGQHKGGRVLAAGFC